MTKVYNVLIVGAGRIGAFFDTLDNENVLTHAHAFSKHPQFNLIGFVDKDFAIATKAAKLWDCKSFQSINDAFFKNKIDVVVVAVCDEHHYRVLKEVLNYKIQLIFAEKPLTKSLKEAEEIVDLSKEKKIPILVNYSRRFVPKFIDLKNKIRSGELGNFVGGCGYYGKGFLHNGSHLIDLLNYFSLSIERVETISKRYDFFDDDPTISAVLKLKNNTLFFIQGVDCSLYTIFELDLFFEKARIRVVDFGCIIEEYCLNDNSIFNGYRNLNIKQKIKADYSKSLYFAAQNIADFLDDKSELLCIAQDVLSVMKVCSI